MNKSNKLITATVAAASTLDAPPLFAQTQSGYQQMQNKVNALQQQVASLKTQVSRDRSSCGKASSATSAAVQSDTPSQDPLKLGGGVVTEYQ